MINRAQIKTIAQIVTLFIIPAILIYFQIIPIQYRFYVLSGVSLIILFIVKVERWTLKELGMRMDNFKSCILPYFILTILAVAVTFLLAQVLDKSSVNIFNSTHFQYGFILVSFIQEFVFRSFLMPKLKILFSLPITVVISNAFLFGLIHIIYPDSLIIFILSFLLGLGFATTYYFYPNLALATIAHSIINFVAVFYCFASFATNCY